MKRFHLRQRAGLASAAILVLGFFAHRSGFVPLLNLVDLGFHELGHLLTYWLPDLMTAAMGSVVQVAVPAGLAWYFLRRQEKPSAALMVAWAGASARNVAVYIGDAPFERLQLIGGDHDWAFIFHHFDAMSLAPRVAGLVGFLGSLAVAVAFVWSATLAATGQEYEPRSPSHSGSSPAWDTLSWLPPGTKALAPPEKNDSH